MTHRAWRPVIGMQRVSGRGGHRPRPGCAAVRVMMLTCMERSKPAKAIDAGSESEASRSQARTRTSRSRLLCADGRFASFGDRACGHACRSVGMHGAKLLSVHCSLSKMHSAHRQCACRASRTRVLMLGSRPQRPARCCAGSGWGTSETRRSPSNASRSASCVVRLPSGSLRLAMRCLTRAAAETCPKSPR